MGGGGRTSGVKLLVKGYNVTAIATDQSQNKSADAIKCAKTSKRLETVQSHIDGNNKNTTHRKP